MVKKESRFKKWLINRGEYILYILTFLLITIIISLDFINISTFKRFEFIANLRIDLWIQIFVTVVAVGGTYFASLLVHKKQIRAREKEISNSQKNRQKEFDFEQWNKLELVNPIMNFYANTDANKISRHFVLTIDFNEFGKFKFVSEINIFNNIYKRIGVKNQLKSSDFQFAPLDAKSNYSLYYKDRNILLVRDSKLSSFKEHFTLEQIEIQKNLFDATSDFLNRINTVKLQISEIVLFLKRFINDDKYSFIFENIKQKNIDIAVSELKVDDYQLVFEELSKINMIINCINANIIKYMVNRKNNFNYKKECDLYLFLISYHKVINDIERYFIGHENIDANTEIFIIDFDISDNSNKMPNNILIIEKEKVLPLIEELKGKGFIV